jgi:hypothetical protein
MAGDLGGFLSFVTQKAPKMKFFRIKIGETLFGNLSK